MCARQWSRYPARQVLLASLVPNSGVYDMQVYMRMPVYLCIASLPSYKTEVSIEAEGKHALRGKFRATHLKWFHGCITPWELLRGSLELSQEALSLCLHVIAVLLQCHLFELPAMSDMKLLLPFDSKRRT